MSDATDREERRKRREAVLKKVRALLKLTVGNGASEAEALHAAAKAAELMAKHDLSMDEVDVRESGTRQQDHALDRTLRAHLTRVAAAIAQITGTRFWVNGSGSLATVGSFFGLPHDVEVAGYLLDICEGAMRRDSGAFEKGIMLLRPSVRSARKDSFLAGMADRLGGRIREMAAGRKATGNALVPLKAALIEEALREARVDLGTARIGRRDLDPASFRKGRAAGERVRLSPGIGGAADARPIRDGQSPRTETEDRA